MVDLSGVDSFRSCYKNMIITILLYVLSLVMGIVAGFCNTLASGFSLWPATVLQGLTYFFTNLMNWNFIFNVVAMLSAFKYLLGFLVLYVGARLTIKIFNFFRGAGGMDI